MKTRRHLVTTFASCALIAVVVATIWVTIHAKDFNPQPDPPAFGLISLNPGQSLRLNVVNTLPPPTDPGRLGSATRHAMLGFDMYRADGRTFTSDVSGPCFTAHHFADRQSCEVMLTPGEAASFDFTSAAEMGITQVLPAVQDDDRNKNPALVYTLEVREGGKVIQLLPAVQRSNTWTGSN
jgi:hypothetical protein